MNFKLWLSEQGQMPQQNSGNKKPLTAQELTSKVRALAQACYDKKPDCDKNIQTLQNAYNNPKQGKLGKEIIGKYLNPILKNKQNIQNIQNNEKQTQAAMQGQDKPPTAQPHQPTKNPSNTDWIKVQNDIAQSAYSKDINKIQEILKQFPNMPPQLQANAQNFIKILTQGKK